MAVLLALGVMSLASMALVAELIAAVKLLPWKAGARRGVAVMLLVLGIAVAFAPERVPGLTIPGSAKAMDGMKMEGRTGPSGATGATLCRSRGCSSVG